MANKKTAGVLLKEGILRRRYPDSGLASKISMSDEDSIWLPSRILPLNRQTGGGLMYGKIMEIFGEESTGKTLLAMDFAVVAQQLGGIVLWNDAECSFNAKWAVKNGLDLSKIELLKDENEIETISDWIADMAAYYRSKLIRNEPILLIGDSIAVWETRLNMEAADTDSGEDMGRRSKKIYQMLRKRRKILSKYGVCSIFVNQVRKKVGASKFEDPDTTPGGMAMRFFADIRIGLYRGKKIVNKNEDKVGQKVYVRTKKNKLAPPGESTEANVYFRKHKGVIGYDKYFFLPETLIDLGIITRKAARFYLGDEQLAYGDAPFLKLLANNNELRKKLVKLSTINTLSITREKINSIGKNLYPVKAKKDKDAEE